MVKAYRSITNIMTRPLYEVIKEYIDRSVGTLYFIMPFITNSVIESLLSDFHGSNITIITSWRVDHLQAGVSSVELYPLSKKNGWSLYINSHLHAKIISDSLDSCIITSANCTKAALVEDEGNIESIICVDEMCFENRIEIERLLYSSIRVDDCLYEQYVDFDYEDGSLDLDCRMIDSSNHFDVECLPQTDSPELLWDYISLHSCYDKMIEHDLSIFTSRMDSFSNKDCFVRDLQDTFLNHPFIQLIESQITNSGTRFGHFKYFIRDHCSNDPKPTPKELVTIVRNLYAWFVYLFPDKYYIWQPNVTQLLTRV